MVYAVLDSLGLDHWIVLTVDIEGDIMLSNSGQIAHRTDICPSMGPGSCSNRQFIAILLHSCWKRTLISHDFPLDVEWSNSFCFTEKTDLLSLTDRYQGWSYDYQRWIYENI